MAKLASNDQEPVVSRLLGIALGPLLATGFLFVVALLPMPVLHRYFLGHPISKAITFLFFISLASMWRVLRTTRRNRLVVDSIPTNSLCPKLLIETSTNIASRAHRWLEHLAGLPHVVRSSWLLKRLEGVLDRQRLRGHAHGLADDLREFSERDADTAHGCLSVVRATIWAIPMFGFLGTVVGITETLGSLDFTNAESAMVNLKAGLYVAFDTTALGICLSVLAIFIQLPVERDQQRLLERIDKLVGSLIPPILPDTPTTTANDPVALLELMTERILAGTLHCVERQTELWKLSFEQAQSHWQSSVSAVGFQVQDALSKAIGKALDKHSQEFDRIQREGNESIEHRWHQWQGTLSDNARIMSQQQTALREQTVLLTNAVEGCADLAALRELLNHNVVALQQTLVSVQETEGLAVAMRTLGRAIEVLAERAGVLQPTLRGRAA